MTQNILFYVVFLSQILLVSYYYPRKIRNRGTQILKKYPPAQYPKLYPKSSDYYKLLQTIYKVASVIIMIIGFVILIMVGIWDSSSNGKVSEVIPVAYFFLQMSPLIIMEIFGFAHFKLMRKTDVRKTRQADLQPRRFFDFISPISLVIAMFMIIACIAFFHSIHSFEFNGSNDTFVIILTLIFSNLLFAAIIYWNIYGKKLDPYQAGEDRLKQIDVTVKSLVYMSIAASTFLMLFEAMDEFQLDYLEPVMMSLYLQFIIFIGLGAMLRSIQIENLNFDVYKEDTASN